jgi:UDPglucose 6-dehydrogenase
VRKGIGSDPRIGASFLFPGAGYGGSCFPKDVKALVRTASECQTPLEVLQAVEDVNERQKRRMFEKLSTALEGKLRGVLVAVWGLAFKPQTDDMREAPALTLIEQLLDSGARVCAHDPVAIHEAKRRLGDRVRFVESYYDAVDGADALAIVTDWNEYRHPDFARIKQALRRPVLVDGRNLYDPVKMAELGFVYDSVGRPMIRHVARPAATLVA